jgi:prephenate dehydratase
VKILKIISDYNLNMTRIGSRPIKERVGEYRFFIEMEADYALANVKKALDDIQAAANSLRILGCY